MKREKSPVVAAIYGIVNTNTGMTYVGGSSNVKSRVKQHKYQLKKGTHANCYLQKDFNILGPSKFEAVILERVTGGKKELVAAEQRWMDKIEMKYNISPRADGSVIAVETRKKISETQKRNRSSGRFTKEFPEYRERNHLNPRMAAEIRRVREEEGLSYKKIGDRFGINHAHVGAIIRREIWKIDYNPVNDILSLIPPRVLTMANEEERASINALLGRIK